MKAFGKIAVKIIAFALIFGLVFAGVQRIFRHKGAAVNYLDERYDAFKDEPADTVDVLFLGSSPMYRGVAPMVLWQQAGITSVNFAVPEQSAFNNYFEFKLALQTQSPKLLVLDFSSLFSDRKADETSFRYEYYRVFDALPSAPLRFEMAKRIVLENEEQSMLDYYFPLLRLHTRWSTLSQADFENQDVFEPYLKGAGLLTSAQPVASEKMFDPADPFSLKEYSAYSLGYYQKIMDLCAENGVAIAAVSFPKENSSVYADEYHSICRFCEDNGIAYFNFNEPELLASLSLDFEKDFYDKGHLNINGALKLSARLAALLHETFSLSDHRQEQAFADWQHSWREFYQAYEAYLAPQGYEREDHAE